jgi:hypothetical protein
VLCLKEEKADDKVERKAITINPNSEIRVKDPVVDADWKTARWYQSLS